MNDIVLKKPTMEYAEEIENFRREIIEAEDTDSFAGCIGLDTADSAEEWIKEISTWENEETCPKDKVPSSMYIAVRLSDNSVVGAIDLRHHINHPVLGVWGGHMGYSVRPGERGKGYAKEMLRQNLLNCSQYGIEKVMITCDVNNVASANVILANGGVLEKEIEVEGTRMNKYWIDVQSNNIFIEGPQGAGKSTLVQKLSSELTDYKVIYEGEYSPVELAWCAYVTEEQYNSVLVKYPSLEEEIKQKTVKEGEHRIICYTKILTDVPGFHKDLEMYEIYNGNLDKESFENVILSRFEKWNGEKQIFECSIFQNIIENQMLYLMMSDDEILDFYRKLKRVLENKPFKILYLDVDDISEAIQIIKKERSDDNGNELWFPLMIQYLEESPYGRKHALTGMDGLLEHLARRRALEHRIINEIFKEHVIIIKAKKYKLDEVITLLKTSNAK